MGDVLAEGGKRERGGQKECGSHHTCPDAPRDGVVTCRAAALKDDEALRELKFQEVVTRPYSRQTLDLAPCRLRRYRFRDMRVPFQLRNTSETEYLGAVEAAGYDLHDIEQLRGSCRDRFQGVAEHRGAEGTGRRHGFRSGRN
jgi:hypothetical protein